MNAEYEAELKATREANTISLNGVPLDKLCGSCDGHGHWGPSDHQKCMGCDGSGYKLTEAGEAIIQLVLRHVHIPK